MKAILRFAALAVAFAALAGSNSIVAPAYAQLDSPDMDAWQFFVTVNSPAAMGKLQWETWTEQNDLYLPDLGLAANKMGRHFHGSVLEALLKSEKLKGAAKTKMLALAASNCNKMAVRPPNVTKDAVICEEVYINPDAVAYIKSQNYESRTGQMAAAKAGTGFDFPRSAMEIKVDWLPTTDFAKPPFACDGSTTNLYTEEVGGTCYALVAMHIISHSWPNWLWATFEPQDATTNPYRCDVYGPCQDSWGGTPAVSKGPSSTTTLTPTLISMMTKANLPAAFQNYRLVQAQTTFTTPKGMPIISGNSITEYEAVGTPRMHSSCITCHSMSSVNAEGYDGAAGFSCPKGSPVPCDRAPIGKQVVTPQGFIARSFLWSFALACPNPTGTGFNTNCKPPPQK